jgi:hypothetical protein
MNEFAKKAANGTNLLVRVDHRQFGEEKDGTATSQDRPGGLLESGWARSIGSGI